MKPKKEKKQKKTKKKKKIKEESWSDSEKADIPLRKQLYPGLSMPDDPAVRVSITEFFIPGCQCQCQTGLGLCEGHCVGSHMKALKVLEFFRNYSNSSEIIY